MSAYYNEFDPHAAQWLRNLIEMGFIAPGEVDVRDIRDVRPDDVRGFTQCHFFAGIGVWSYALRSAGWPDDQRVWTGSAPCQGFSTAGQQRGFDDQRHLWPALHRLVDDVRPPVLFGEQVASSLVLGPSGSKAGKHGPYGLYGGDCETRNAEAWIDLVQADLEGSGYAVGIQATPAACVGAPHIRLRTYFVGHALGLADMHGDGWPEKRERVAQAGYDGSKRDCPSSRLVDRVGARLEGQRRHGDGGRGRQVSTGPIAPSSEPRSISPRTTRGEPERRPGPTNGFWGDADWLRCRDGKWRPTLAGSFPLVDGSAFRVDSGGPFAGRSRKEMLKGAGNAIVAEHAAAFIQTYMEARDQLVRGGRIGNRPFRNIEDDI